MFSLMPQSLRVNRPAVVLEGPIAAPRVAHEHFAAKLSLTVDPDDLWADMQQQRTGFTLIDARGAQAFARYHIPGAINLPARALDERGVEQVDLEASELLIVYGWGSDCHAAASVAAALSGKDYPVKELAGGIDRWRREWFPVEGTLGLPGSRGE